MVYDIRPQHREVLPSPHGYSDSLVSSHWIFFKLYDDENTSLDPGHSYHRAARATTLRLKDSALRKMAMMKE